MEVIEPTHLIWKSVKGTDQVLCNQMLLTSALFWRYYRPMCVLNWERNDLNLIKK